MGRWWRDEVLGLEDELVLEVVGAATQVWRVLGARFAPSVYRAALTWELRAHRLQVAERPTLPVKYQGRVVGEFCPDLLVGERVLVELEAAKKLHAARIHDARRTLAATRLPAGVLLNFGAPKLEVRRLARAG